MAKKKSSRGRSVKSPGTQGSPGKTPQKKGVQLKPVERPSHMKGIERLVFVEASSLKDHPDNWKTHSKRQLESLDAEFDSVGWVLPLAYNLETGRLLDGHGRKRTEHVKENKIVPVVVGRWTKEQEDQILLHLDPVGGMFETDGAKFRALMDRYRNETKEALAEASEDHRKSIEHVNESLDAYQSDVEYGAPASFLPDYRLWDPESENAQKIPEEDEREKIVKMEESPEYMDGLKDFKTFEELPFNCFGEGDIYDIPKLRPDHLGSAPSHLQTWVGPETPEADAYFYIYGSAAIEKVRSHRLIVAYYTYDRKFESIWNDPRKFTARMLNFKVHAVISPNFSAWLNCPEWFQIHQIARTRWLGRYWQEAGLDVIPDISLINMDNEKYIPLLLAGLPRELPAISIQVQQKGEMKIEGYYVRKRRALFEFLKLIHPHQIIIYHGPDFPQGWTKAIDKSIEIIKVKSWMWERGEILKKKEYLK